MRIAKAMFLWMIKNRKKCIWGKLILGKFRHGNRNDAGRLVAAGGNFFLIALFVLFCFSSVIQETKVVKTGKSVTGEIELEV